MHSHSSTIPSNLRGMHISGLILRPLLRPLLRLRLLPRVWLLFRLRLLPCLWLPRLWLRLLPRLLFSCCRDIRFRFVMHLPVCWFLKERHFVSLPRRLLPTLPLRNTHRFVLLFITESHLFVQRFVLGSRNRKHGVPLFYIGNTFLSWNFFVSRNVAFLSCFEIHASNTILLEIVKKHVIMNEESEVQRLMECNQTF